MGRADYYYRPCGAWGRDERGCDAGVGDPTLVLSGVPAWDLLDRPAGPLVPGPGRERPGGPPPG